MTNSTISKVLVTGATGFIGAHVVDRLLARGVSVRATTRSKQKGDVMKAARPQYASKLEFVQIEDFTQIGVFDHVMNGIDAVVHVASPLTYDTTNNEQELIIPAINGVKSILSASAQPSSQVKRIVMTSSFASVIDINRTLDQSFTYDGSIWNPLTYEEAIHPDTNAVVAYRGSKKFAELEAWNYIEREKPGFDLVTFCPPMTFGPVVHPVANVKQLNESNAGLWGIASGEPLPSARVTAWIDVRDLAEAHVRAVFTSEVGGKRYTIAAQEPFSYEFAADIMREELEWARDTVTKDYEQGKKPSQSYRVDGKMVTKDLGVEFRGFRETVVDFVTQVNAEIPK